jgi:orotate phosphoribosyltransferase
MTEPMKPPTSGSPALASTPSVAEILVSTGAVAFRTDPFFRFTSGVESPVYVDNRRLLGHVAERELVVAELAAAAQSEGSGSVGAVAGTATAGIPWAAWLADRLQLPLLYVRAQAKEWGHARAVEGVAPAGQEVLVVEDLAFTAGSLRAATEHLREAGYVVDKVLTIVSYGTPTAASRMHALAVMHHTLTTIDAALRAASAMGTLDDSQVEVVEQWLATIREPKTQR